MHQLSVSVAVCLAVCGSSIAFAGQQESGTIAISGTITDPSGGVVAEATVSAIVAGRAVANVLSAQDGGYRLEVPAGVPFQVRVVRPGFAEEVVDVEGTTSDIARDIALTVGGLSDTLVVTASRGLEDRARVTQAVTVATATDIGAIGASSLADVVRVVPGLNVESAGREGALTSLFARGGESDYNLVLIDGVRVNLSGGQFDFSRIAAGEIERVEVVRGAQSSLWGSDAMGAVVQVFTKRAGQADAPVASGSIEGGSFNTWRGDLRLAGGATGRVDYSAGLAHRRSDGAFADLLPEDDVFEQTAFDGGFGVTLGTRANLRTGLRYSNAQAQSVGNIAYGIFDTGASYDTKDLSWHTEVSHAVRARFTGTATFNFFRNQGASIDTISDATANVYAILEGTPGAIFPDSPRLVRVIGQSEFDALSSNGAAPGPSQFLAFTPFGVSDFFSTSRTEFRRPAVKYQGDYAWGSGQRLSAGYEWERETNPLVDGFSLDNNAIFIQQQVSAGERWFLTVGGRADAKESYDTFFSPKLSAGGFLVPYSSGAVSSVKVFGNVGKGIKSPTFTERFGGSFADPTPALKVERARTADVGIEATFAAQRLRAVGTYFDNRFRDQIEFLSSSPTFSPDGVPDYINIAGSKARGVELEVALLRAIGGIAAMGNYSLVDTEVAETIQTGVQFQPGQPLLRRPKHSGTLRVSYARGIASVYFDARFVGQRHDSSFLSLRSVPNATLPRAVTTDITVNPGYAVAGVGIDLRAHRTLTVFVRANNVADTEYESALGYPGMPRTVMLGARFGFGLR
jgi:outer membrane cobalamin receptor